jgi:hypothetical protein
MSGHTFTRRQIDGGGGGAVVARRREDTCTATTSTTSTTTPYPSSTSNAATGRRSGICATSAAPSQAARPAAQRGNAGSADTKRRREPRATSATTTNDDDDDDDDDRVSTTDSHGTVGRSDRRPGGHRRTCIPAGPGDRGSVPLFLPGKISRDLVAAASLPNSAVTLRNRQKVPVFIVERLEFVHVASALCPRSESCSPATPQTGRSAPYLHQRRKDRPR